MPDPRATARTSPWAAAALCGVAACVAVWWAYGTMSAAARSLGAAEEDLAEAGRMAADVERFRRRPRVASLTEQSPGEISEQVSAAVRAAGVPVEALRTVQPATPVRVGDGPYTLRSTTIELEDVPLETVARFARNLENEEFGTVVRKLRLTEPNTPAGAGRTGKERWTAELTLTQTIFSPTLQGQ